jgi:hypothetical protein
MYIHIYIRVGGGGGRVQPTSGDDDIEQNQSEKRERISQKESEKIKQKEKERISQKERERVSAMEQRNNETELKQLQSKGMEEQRQQKLENQRAKDVDDKRVESEFQEKKKKELEEEALRREKEAENKKKKKEKEKNEADALAALLIKQEADKQKDIDKEKIKKIDFHTILTIPLYKSIWPALTTAGSFQCKLKVTPELSIIIAHLKKQGFHVVYSTETANESEVGFCNIRTSQKTEALFMGKFTVKENFFQADMKCENTNEVPLYVKKFALAKVLKIDTSA